MRGLLLLAVCLAAGCHRGPERAQHPGSCCQMAGTCHDVADEADCLEGGVFTNGTPCSVSICSGPGACCETGSCTQVSAPSECGGEFHVAEDCENVNCVAPASGACCLTDGACVNVASEG